jgi:hypothetical protein
MQQASLSMISWPALVDAVSAVVDLPATARATQAFVRPRKVRRAADLLRLALMYGAGKLSLRGVAAEATALDVAALSDVAVLKRLRNCGDWLALILDHLLAARAGVPQGAAVPRLALVDGSTVSVPGSEGSDWRLHARYEPAVGRFTDLVLTDAATAEGLRCVAVSPGDVIVADRGYARVRNFAHLQAVGSDFITRIGWRSVKLFDGQGQPFDPLAGLPPAGVEVAEHAVHIGRAATPARLVIQRIPAEKLAQQHARLRRKASKRGHKTDPRTTLAAGYLMLLTSLPAALCPPERVAALYRLRWQIDIYQTWCLSRVCWGGRDRRIGGGRRLCRGDRRRPAAPRDGRGAYRPNRRDRCCISVNNSILTLTMKNGTTA